MSLFSAIGSALKKGTDRWVNFASGANTASAPDSPVAYRALGAFGVVVLVLSGWLVVHNIQRVGVHPSTNNNTNTSAIAELEKLKSKDTDTDGLSDYDELFGTQTSPYLLDSDGDGVSDKTEIAKNQDPNCPQGKTCTGVSADLTPADSAGRLTPAFLRQALLASGVPESTLEQTDDAALVDIYNRVIASSGASVNTNTSNTNSATTTPTVEQLQQLSASDIRDLLVENGIDRTTLDKLDDATVREIFNQAITNTNSSN